ncbi:high osmolarity signaling protein SHO1 [Coccidioides immitis RS]|uniref:High osmolarity signaling protein SHO1 n=3 Tax=Coccidioides immitis TaxID=5501 RepID=J3K8Y5_COCIM|nr:high osmolarity signaling protein SHO1 [Coccidioides immitis RS]EAS31320.3 high osmolarity signaling protein SHO1 [Coccidioides immitis RS]
MARINIDNLVGDPFALASISISLLAWLITFISAIISDVRGFFPNIYWWTIAYQLLCILGISYVMATGTSHIYSTAIVGYVASAFAFTTFAVDVMLKDKSGSKEAAGAGFILLSIINIIWIFYFGSTAQPRPRTYIDSFAMHKEQPSYLNPSQMSNHYNNRPDTTLSSQPPQMYTSAQLNGFETSSPIPGYGGGQAGQSGASGLGNSQVNLAANGSATGDASNEVSPPTEYPYRAKAIYSYEANPDDANEISFTKHEILEVSDVSGRWWQAKKSTGETGIAPSNYLILL